METGRIILPPLPLRLPENKPETFHFVLGAQDAEMDEIEIVLQEMKMRYSFATREGTRVTPRTCYEADPIPLEKGVMVVCVECEPREFLGDGLHRLVDHHRELDFGFGKPPADFWEASSLGQIYALLKKKDPSEMHLVIAARDHCRFDAEKGLCPGVTPAQIKWLGHAHLAQELKVPLVTLHGAIRRMRRIIHASPKMQMGRQTIADLRHVHVPHIYSLPHMAIYEALAEMGRAALILTKNKLTDPAPKAVLVGSLKAETVRHFMEVWAPAQGLLEIYGCEVRGYAGGYYTTPLYAQATAA